MHLKYSQIVRNAVQAIQSNSSFQQGIVLESNSDQKHFKLNVLIKRFVSIINWWFFSHDRIKFWTSVIAKCSELIQKGKWFLHHCWIKFRNSDLPYEIFFTNSRKNISVFQNFRAIFRLFPNPERNRLTIFFIPEFSKALGGGGLTICRGFYLSLLSTWTNVSPYSDCKVQMNDIIVLSLSDQTEAIVLWVQTHY